MKIAQIAPTWYPLPPKKYGGIERIVSELTEELVKRKHKVDLFASKDSKTKSHLIPSLFDSPKDYWTKLKSDFIYIHAKAVELQDNYDLLHFHMGIDTVPLSFMSLCKKPCLVTVHNHVNNLMKFYEYYKSLNYISISNNHRTLFPKQLNFLGNVHNGVPIEKFKFSNFGGDYLAFLGTISPNKGIIESLQVAINAKLRLKIAAKIDLKIKNFYEEEVKPIIQHNSNISFIGEVDDKGKNSHLGHAKLLLFPINWEEPFGLVMIEAMACGTPVVAFNRGSVSEIIKDGETGYIVKHGDINGMVKAVRRIFGMPEDEYRKMRQNCLKHVKDNFTTGKMVDRYECIYQQVITKSKK